MLAAEYALSIATWVVLLGDFIVELNCYVKQRTWLVRFPILFIFAGEVAKLRWVQCSFCSNATATSVRRAFMRESPVSYCMRACCGPDASAHHVCQMEIRLSCAGLSSQWQRAMTISSCST